MKRILGTYMFPLKQFVCDCCEKESAVTSSKSSKLPAGWIEVNGNHYCSACVKRGKKLFRKKVQVFERNCRNNLQVIKLVRNFATI